MPKYIALLAATVLGSFVAAGASTGGDDKKKQDVLAGWTYDFSAEKGALVPSGRNPYFILEPGYVLVLRDRDKVLTIRVNGETKKVDGVVCRVVEEKETEGDKAGLAHEKP
jgi:hypothetical protein